MAFLLLLHQRMSLQRKVNKLTLAQTSIGQHKERITKRIEKVQKAYAKKQSKLDAQAKMMTSYTNNQVQQQNWMMSQQMQNITYAQILYEQNTDDYKAIYDSAQGKAYDSPEAKALQEWQEKHKDAVTAAQQQAYDRNSQISWQRQMMQQQMNAYTTSVNDQVSIWLEMQKQALEDEEQMALAPLEEEDTQIDLEQASNEAQLSYAQSRLDAIKQALDSRAQEAPKFGA
jgi:hypothetical protein